MMYFMYVCLIIHLSLSVADQGLPDCRPQISRRLQRTLARAQSRRNNRQHTHKSDAPSGTPAAFRSINFGYPSN